VGVRVGFVGVRGGVAYSRNKLALRTKHIRVTNVHRVQGYGMRYKLALDTRLRNLVPRDKLALR